MKKGMAAKTMLDLLRIWQIHESDGMLSSVSYGRFKMSVVERLQSTSYQKRGWIFPGAFADSSAAALYKRVSSRKAFSAVSCAGKYDGIFF